MRDIIGQKFSVVRMPLIWSPDGPRQVHQCVVPRVTPGKKTLSAQFTLREQKTSSNTRDETQINLTIISESCQLIVDIRVHAVVAVVAAVVAMVLVL